MAEDPLDEIDGDLDESMGDILDESMSDIMDDVDGMDDLDSADDLGDVSRDIEEKEDGSKANKISESLKSLLKKISGAKKIIIISIVSVLVIGIAAWVLFFEGTDEDSGVPVPSDPGQNSVSVMEEIVFEDIVELEPFERIPLKTSSSMGMISINMALELVNKDERAQIYLVEERIRQIVMDQMMEITWLELRNPEGKIMLKYNLLNQINSLFPKTTVRNVYFTYFVMQ